MVEKGFWLVNVTLESFMGLLLCSMNMVSLIFNFCSVVRFYDAASLLDASQARCSFSSLNYSLRFLKILLRIMPWQSNKTLHHWPFLPPGLYNTVGYLCVTLLLLFVAHQFHSGFKAVFSTQQEGRKWPIALILLAFLHNGYKVLWPKLLNLIILIKDVAWICCRKILILFPS